MIVAAESAPSLAITTTTQALPFRRDGDDAPFPLAGAILLLALIAVAAWAWTIGRRSPRTGPAFLSGKWPFLGHSPSASGEQIRVVGSARLDLGGRVHVVEWRGQQVLVAVNGASAPVVLARRDIADPAPESQG